MENWILTGKRAITKQEQNEIAVLPSQVKVKVTHVLVSNYDAHLFNGDVTPSYPKTIGRWAIGIVTEVGEECYGIERGSKVYLKPAKSCGECVACKSGDSENCHDILIAGKDFNGFLRDFVVCEYTDVAILPDDIDDMYALCIENVALAEQIFDRLALPVGSKVAIIGSGFTANLLCQIAQYHKLVPIVIDNNAQNVERAKKAGAFYCFAADDDLITNVAEATGGAMCDASIFTTCSNLRPSLSARVVKNRADVVFAGFSTVNFSLEANYIFEKNLKIFAITNGYDYSEVAINMIMHGAITLEYFEKETLTDFDVQEVLAKRLEEISHSSKMTVLKLII